MTFQRFNQFSSVTQSCPTLWPHELQHARLPCPSPTPRAYSNSCPLSRWCHPTISSSIVPFSLLQSFLASGSFQVSHSLHQVAKVSEIQLQLSPSNKYSGLISFRMDSLDLLQSKGLSRVPSNTTVQKHQFFDTQHFFHSNSHIHTWLLESNYPALTRQTK